ncbi:MAG: DUF1571 domain-containing protein [Planctomycetota bacterium]
MLACIVAAVGLSCVAGDAEGQVLAAAGSAGASADSGSSDPRPLAAVLRVVEESQRRLEKDVQDYTCRIVRRERLGGKLGPYDFIDAKIRRPNPAAGTPFSVYLRFTTRPSLAGREVLFLEGRNSGKVLVRRGGQRLAYLTTYVDPMSPLAMQGNRHPVTEVGFDRLLGKIAKGLVEDMTRDEVEVRFFDNAKIDGRPCTRIAIIHPEPRPYFTYHRTELYFDAEHKLPAAFATYQWPEEPGGAPILVEQYVYDRLELNVGLTDADFDRGNPDYRFLKR